MGTNDDKDLDFGEEDEFAEEREEALDTAGEDLDDDAGESEDGSDELEEMDEEPGPIALSEPAAPTTKHCVFCGSEIAVAALRCPHCSGYLPIAEGTIFKQYFWFLFASLAMAIGCILPWERDFVKFNLTGLDAIGGGFLFLFAVYGVIVSHWNIYHRKMIVWPVMLAALDGVFITWPRVFKILGRVGDELANKDWTGWKGFAKLQYQLKEYFGSIGPGLYLVTMFSTLVLLSVLVSVFQGAKQDARRKAEEREMRASSRSTRRS